MCNYVAYNRLYKLRFFTFILLLLMVSVNLVHMIFDIWNYLHLGEYS